MAFQYAVTAQPPTAVTHALKARLTGPDDDNLVVVRSTLLEVYTVSPEGLVSVANVPLYGRVAVAEAFRPEGCTCDVLLLSFERFQFCVLGYNAETGEIETRAFGDAEVGVPWAGYGVACTGSRQERGVCPTPTGLTALLPQASVGRLADSGQLGAVDPECRCAILRHYDGVLRVLPMRSEGKLAESFDVR